MNKRIKLLIVLGILLAACLVLALAAKPPVTPRDGSRGILAVNLSQAAYQPGDVPRLEIGVVDQKGRTVCDADVRVRVRREVPLPALAFALSGVKQGLAYLVGQAREKTLSLKAAPSAICREDFPAEPDYAVDVPVHSAGRYIVEVSARFKKGALFVRDTFTVTEQLPFQVQRRADTRIYPRGYQHVAIELTAAKAFRGTVVERVPDAFEVRASSHGQRHAGVLRNRKKGIKSIVWKLDLKAGERVTLGYLYDVTAISPRYYEIGPLAMVDGRDATVLNEGRAWQVASDVASGVIVAWPSTNASIPAGWSRVTALDTYYLEGTTANPSATAGGNATHSHTSPTHQHTLGGHTHSGTTGGAVGTISTGARAEGSANGHTHTITTDANSDNNVAQSANLGTASNDPPYTAVIWIKSNGTTDIPNGAWALFNSDTLPGSWSRVSGNRFLKGAAAAGDGGGTGGSSDNHTHTDSGHTHTENSHTHTGTTAASATSVLKTKPGSTTSVAGHTHTISGGGVVATEASGTATLANADGQPPFYKLNIIQNGTGGASLPTNIIAMWDGTTASIPAGWILCDGGGACPNLDNYFIKGANADAEIGTTGGGLTHTHPGTGAAHSHTINSHTHNFTVVAEASGGESENGSGTTGSSYTHTHTLSLSGGGTTGTAQISANANTDNRPPYKEICYIQYTGAAATRRRVYFISSLEDFGRGIGAVREVAATQVTTARIALYQHGPAAAASVFLIIFLSLCLHPSFCRKTGQARVL